MEHTPATRPLPLATLVAGRVMDVELAALVALLLEQRVPVIVAGPPGTARDDVLDAVRRALSPAARVVEVAGAAEAFEWLPEATELGWRREPGLVVPVGRDGVERASSSNTVLLVRDLGGDAPGALDGERTRIVVRALALGYGMVAGITADGLEGVLARLHEPSIGADEDERSRLGIVLALAHTHVGPRVTAAHYVRPTARDVHGHVQRLPPAVLATWDPAADRWDHFAWGVLPELALRLDQRPIDLERAQARMASALRSATA